MSRTYSGWPVFGDRFGCPVLSKGHMPVPKQLPQIPVLPARYPDLRKTIFQQQLQDQSRILAVRLLLAHTPSADPSRIADPQLKLQLGQQPFKPARMSAGSATVLTEQPH